MMKHFPLFLILLLLPLLSFSQDEKQYSVACVGFYNIENLFDTINQPEVRDEEFTPDGPNAWTSERYYDKLNKLAYVIARIGTDISPDGMAILGLSEIENRSVIQDLIDQAELKDRGYAIVHYDSPDRRGVDVGLIYQQRYFQPSNTKSYRLRLPDRPNFLTRDQLLVSGYLQGEMIHLIVNHWPSRSGGEQRSRPLRMAAADLTRHIVDSLLHMDPNAKILVMGDLNDDPVDPSVKRNLKAVGSEEHLDGFRLYNPMESLYKKGIGSLAYRDNWNLFDQVILSQALIPKDQPGWFLHTARVYNKEYLRQVSGSFKGYPFRSFAGGNYLGGYSDHFPVYVVLARPIP